MPPSIVIALVATKGGSGKSTLSACLAAEYRHRGLDVALLDVDPQQTLSDWHRAGGPLQALPIGAASGTSVEPALLALRKKHGLVVVDTAGFQNRDTLSVLKHADVALVPFTPSPADALGAAKTLRLLADVNATQERRKNPVRVLLAMNGASRNALAAHIRREMEATGATVLKTTVGRRVVFGEAMLAGSAPCWMGSGAKAAAEEISAMATEIGI